MVGLCGDLGSGKTHFTKGLVEGLGGDGGAVASPTFTLVHEYRGGRLPVFHFDFYRLESAGELRGIGWEEYLEEAGVVVVEWADRFAGVLPRETVWVRFRQGAAGEESRILEVTP